MHLYKYNSLYTYIYSLTLFEIYLLIIRSDTTGGKDKGVNGQGRVAFKKGRREGGKREKKKGKEKKKKRKAILTEEGRHGGQNRRGLVIAPQ